MRITTTGLFIVCLGMSTAAFAAKNPNPDINRQELQNFDNFLDTHPAIDAELTKNPRLIESPEWVSAHPELKAFMASHPGVREEMKETPRFFMHREEQFDKSGRDESLREVASLDVFLDTHPGIEKELRKDPSLVKNPEFISKHPEFSEFLTKHPAIRSDLKENPKAFMHREAELERLEKIEARDRERNARKTERRENKGTASTPPKAGARTKTSA